MLVINLIALLVRTLNTHIKALVTLAVVLVIRVALNITQIAYDFPFVKVFFLFPDRLNTIQLRPYWLIERYGS
jgi:surface polysaccharide O-acyltransferase-like enzyme